MNISKEVIKNISLCLLVIIICLVVFELVIRLIYVGSFSINCKMVSNPDSLIENVPKNGWGLKKNLDSCYFLRGKFVRIKTNDNGNRATKNISENKENFRVLLLGDSFVENYGVSDEKIMSTKLQEFLGDKYEVINTGVRGYGTDQEIWIHVNYLKYQPDLVIFYVFLNDYSDNINALNTKDNFEMEYVPSEI